MHCLPTHQTRFSTMNFHCWNSFAQRHHQCIAVDLLGVPEILELGFSSNNSGRKGSKKGSVGISSTQPWPRKRVPRVIGPFERHKCACAGADRAGPSAGPPSSAPLPSVPGGPFCIVMGKKPFSRPFNKQWERQSASCALLRGATH